MTIELNTGGTTGPIDSRLARVNGALNGHLKDNVASLRVPEQDLRPSRAEAETAVRTLIRWAGDNPEREGLRETPARVARAYEEWFGGYDEDPESLLLRTFEEVGGYDEMVLLRNIRFESHCEHHMAPIIGSVHIGYLPRHRVVGISKLARLVEVYAKRLQIQERMTAEIAGTLERVLQPVGVGVVVRCPRLHDDPWSSQSFLDHGYEPFARKLPRPIANTSRVSRFDKKGHRPWKPISLNGSRIAASIPMALRT